MGQSQLFLWPMLTSSRSCLPRSPPPSQPCPRSRRAPSAPWTGPWLHGGQLNCAVAPRASQHQQDLHQVQVQVSLLTFRPGTPPGPGPPGPDSYCALRMAGAQLGKCWQGRVAGSPPDPGQPGPDSYCPLHMAGAQLGKCVQGRAEF